MIEIYWIFLDYLTSNFRENAGFSLATLVAILAIFWLLSRLSKRKKVIELSAAVWGLIIGFSVGLETWFFVFFAGAFGDQTMTDNADFILIALLLLIPFLSLLGILIGIYAGKYYHAKVNTYEKQRRQQILSRFHLFLRIGVAVIAAAVILGLASLLFVVYEEQQRQEATQNRQELREVAHDITDVSLSSLDQEDMFDLRVLLNGKRDGKYLITVIVEQPSYRTVLFERTDNLDLVDSAESLYQIEIDYFELMKKYHEEILENTREPFYVSEDLDLVVTLEPIYDEEYYGKSVSGVSDENTVEFPVEFTIRSGEYFIGKQP